MSKLYDLLYTIIGKTNKSLRTEAQVLTEDQKIQARANIGAMSASYTPPTQTAQQVGADPVGTASGLVSGHNENTSAHNDIRQLISSLTTRLDTLFDSDDTTLDQLSEIVEYIKDNKELIDGVTTSKVNVADIVDNLTTADAKKVLSANQGVELKKLINNLSEAVNNNNGLTSTEIDTLMGLIQ